MKKLLPGLVLIISLTSACSSLTQLVASTPENSRKNNTPSASERRITATESLEETLEKYERITEDMTPTQVELILGKADTINRIDIPGESATQMYIWRNENGSTITLQFQNNSLISKFQLGLVNTVTVTM